MIKSVCPSLAQVHSVRAPRQLHVSQAVTLTDPTAASVHLQGAGGTLQLDGTHLLSAGPPGTSYLHLTVNGQHVKLPMG